MIIIETIESNKPDYRPTVDYQRIKRDMQIPI